MYSQLCHLHRIGYACTPSEAFISLHLPTRYTRVPAATHAVHAVSLGSYACHAILHTALPPKVLDTFQHPCINIIVLFLLSLPQTAQSCFLS